VETPVSAPQIGEGHLRAPAVTATARIPELPDIPTLAEAGVANVVGGTYLAMMGPAGIPTPIAGKLEAVCRQITATDDFKARMKALAATPIGSTADELTARMRDEVRRWSAVVKEANIKFEQ
jgi:tripartite-type tricarboxylate transporter receptor subunit TctC